ncbi:hypothetical protein QLQ12_32240 [Actinoplanes sp. NEAU-A12]|uniref:DUF2029 domain-containing protein n=1 Tax=Actinoplanes sandaracinus TaxID=3045177 RepID=A0ABT6WUA3_9ACTN|nr:hypothetical protein [Actinoplanes sandaracinus]MDI6103289.1 hypothetical protein [Actinoplanes sandaracinus]
MTTTLMDRFVRWNLDFDGDLYGRDERERLRWYEGAATVAQLQAITVPWAAAGLVWVVGAPVAWPLAIVLAALLIPIAIRPIYVKSRQVEITPREWSRKRLLLGALAGLPYCVFIVGLYYHVFPGSDTWWMGIIGATFGLGVGAVIQGRQTRRVRRQDALAVGDED